MPMIIEARIDDGVGGGEAIRLAEFGRLDGDLKQLGPNLTEGRSLVHEAQRAFVCAQTRVVVSASLNCPQCGRALSIKATHAIRYRTVFGKVTNDSPQLRVWLERAWRICRQRPKDKGELYALHAPEVEECS